MTNREFTVPGDDEFADHLGVRPQPGDETGVSVLWLEGTAGPSAEVVLDVLRRSVLVRLSDRGINIVEVYREGAVSVRLSRTPPELAIDFETDDTKGSLRISVSPGVSIAEAVLRV